MRTRQRPLNGLHQSWHTPASWQWPVVKRAGRWPRCRLGRCREIGTGSRVGWPSRKVVYKKRLEKLRFEQFGHKNAKKTTKIGDPLDFLASPSTIIKRVFPKPQDTPPFSGFSTTEHLSPMSKVHLRQKFTWEWKIQKLFTADASKWDHVEPGPK